jgi:two-component system, OmpR family, sensor kinase
MARPLAAEEREAPLESGGLEWPTGQIGPDPELILPAGPAGPGLFRRCLTLRRRSARARILGWFVVMMVVAIAASLLVERQVLLVRQRDRTDTQLQVDAAALERAANPSGGNPRSVAALFSSYLKTHVPGPAGQLLTLIGGRVYQSSADAAYPLQRIPGFLRTAATANDSELGTVSTPAGPARYIIVPVAQPGTTSGTFVAASFTRDSEGEVNGDVGVAAAVSLTILLAMTLIAWGVAGRVLAPVRLMTEAAISISDTDLSRRIPPTGDDEISALAGAFNAMLDRLESAMVSQREFVSDAGHELRTPITVIRGHLELMGVDPADRAQTLALVNDELARMTRMVDDLLLLAKAERPDFLVLRPVHLQDLANEMMAKIVALGPRDWACETRGDGVTLADRERLTQAVMNLADNAVVHTQSGDRITLRLNVGRQAYRLSVSDTGSGIPLAEQDRIFDRFARGRNERRRSSGAGLGLSIVQAIAEAHRGTVEVVSEPGEGATFTLVLPRQAAAEER